MTNLEAALRAECELGVGVVQIWADSPEYERLQSPPPCPAVAIDGRIFVENGAIDYDDLRRRLVREDWDAAS